MDFITLTEVVGGIGFVILAVVVLASAITPVRRFIGVSWMEFKIGWNQERDLIAERRAQEASINQA